MRQILLWWRDNPDKKQIMQSGGIKTITFEQIKSIYLELKK